MFLAHMTGWSYTELNEMPAVELSYWAKEAVDLHNFLNRPADK